MTQNRKHRAAKIAHTRRNRTIGIAAAAAAGAGLVAAALRFGWLDRLRFGREGHRAPDLALDKPRPGTDGRRAPVDFRPDPEAPVPASEREALRPATGPGPSITEPNGSMASQTAPSNS